MSDQTTKKDPDNRGRKKLEERLRSEWLRMPVWNLVTEVVKMRQMGHYSRVLAGLVS